MPKKTTPIATKTTEKSSEKAKTAVAENAAKSTEKKSVPSVIAPNTKLTVTIPWEKAEPAYKKARTQVAQTLKVSGFRKGKVPADVAEKMMGPSDIIEKALEFILPDAYIETVKAANKRPLTQPSFQAVSLEVGKEWVIEAQIAEKPEIKLGDFKKIVKEAKIQAKKDVEKQAEEIKKHNEEHKDHDHGPKELTEEQKKEITLQRIYQNLIEAIKPQIPELLVRHEVEYDIEQLGRQLQSIQMDFQQYMERRQITQEELTQQMAAGALSRIQLVFIIDTLAEETKQVVTDAELETYLTEKVDPATREQHGASPDYKALVSQTMLRQKVADYLLAI